MAFEILPDRLARRRINIDRTKTARITHYGALVFSKSAIEEFELTKWNQCQLFWDKSRNVIGIQPVDNSLSPSKVVRRLYKTMNSAHVMVTSLFRHYNLNIASNMVCPVALEHLPSGELVIAVNISAALCPVGDVIIEQPRRGISRRKNRPGTEHK